MANLRFTPFMQSVVGLSFLRDKRWVYPWEAAYEDTNRLGYGDETAISAFVRWGSGPFSLMGEYLYYDYPIPDWEDPTEVLNVTGTGFSIFPMMRLSEKFEIVGRYDFWDPDTDGEDAIWQAPEGWDWETSSPSHPWWIPKDYDASYHFVKHTVYVAGFNYNIAERMKGAPGVIFQFNWQRMDPQEEIDEIELDPIDSFIFQVRWGWGGLNF
jgi:hypothetical protein